MSSTAQAASLDPKQRVRSGGVALHGEIGLNDWLKFRTITALPQGQQRTRRSTSTRTPQSISTFRPSTRTTSSARNSSWSPTRARFRASRGVYYLTPTPSTCSTCGFTPPMRCRDCRASPPRPAATSIPRPGRCSPISPMTFRRNGACRSAAATPTTSATRMCSAQSLFLGGSPELGGLDPASTRSAFPFRDRPSTLRISTAGAPTPRSRRAHRSSSSRRRTTISTSAIRGASKAAASTRAASPPRLALEPARPRRDSLRLHGVRARDGRQLRSGLEGVAVRPPAAVRARDLRRRVQGRAGPGIGRAASSAACRPSAASRPTPARRASAASSSRPTGASRRISRPPATGSTFAGHARLSRREISAVHHRESRIPARRSWIRALAISIEIDVADFRKIQNTPKWTLSGSLDYDTPLASGRLDRQHDACRTAARASSSRLTSRVSTRPASRCGMRTSSGAPSNGRYELGLHGKNLANKKYITSGYNFLRQNPVDGGVHPQRCCRHARAQLDARARRLAARLLRPAAAGVPVVRGEFLNEGAASTGRGLGGRVPRPSASRLHLQFPRSPDPRHPRPADQGRSSSQRHRVRRRSAGSPLPCSIRCSACRWLILPTRPAAAAVIAALARGVERIHRAVRHRRRLLAIVPVPPRRWRRRGRRGRSVLCADRRLFPAGAPRAGAGHLLAGSSDRPGRRHA